MNNGSSDLFNFKPHEIDLYKHLTAYTGLAWQFNYQKSKQKRPNKKSGR
jgi:hypothetical protein